MFESRTSGWVPLILAIALPGSAAAHGLLLSGVVGGRLSSPATYGDYVYIATGPTIGVWDVSHPAAPVFVPSDQQFIGGPTCGLAVVNTTLYSCTAGQNGGSFIAYSLADPAHPSYLNLQCCFLADRITAGENHVYLISPNRGIDTFDVSDPRYLIWNGITGVLDSSIQKFVFQSGKLVLAGENDFGNQTLTLMELAPPSRPLAVGGVATDFGASDWMLVQDSLIKLDSALTVYDASDPADIAQVFSQSIEPATRMLIDVNALYLFGGAEMQIWDFSTPSRPLQLPSTPIDTTGAEEVLSTQRGVLVLEKSGFATLIDDSRLTHPTVASTFQLPGGVDVKAGALDDHYLYLADSTYGLKIADAVTFAPVANVEIGDVDTRGALDIALQGHTAFALANDGLHAIDVADPTHPAEIGHVALPFFDHVVVDGNHAYLIAQNQPATFAIVDIADAGHMQVSSTLVVDSPHGIAVHGQYAYLATEGGLVDEAGLRIVDVSNPQAPAQVGQYTDCGALQGTAVDVSADGQTAYLGCADNFLHILDVSNPGGPELIGLYEGNDPMSGPTSVSARDATLYVGNGSGVDEVDIGDPATPFLAARYATYWPVASTALSPNGSLLVSTGAAGTYLFVGGPRERGHSTHARPAHSPTGNRSGFIEQH